MRYRLSPLSNREITTGVAISGATVTVYKAGGSVLATCYADITTATPLVGSQTTTTSSGYFEFYLDAADYRPTQKFKIVISKAGYADVTYDQLSVILPVNNEINLLDFLPPNYVTDGSVDYTTQVLAALTYASANALGIVFGSKMIVQTSPIVIANSGNVPLYVNLNGSTLKVKTGSTGAFVTVENPHGKIPYGFRFENGTLNANGQCSTGFYLHGSQNAKYEDLKVINSTGIGIHVSGETGYGVYYNNFSNILSGQSSSSNGSHGWNIVSIGSTTYIASNSFYLCKAQFNKGDGFYIDRANNTYIACEAERNDTYGYNLDTTYASDFFGGYTEHNHENWATLGSSDGTPDTAFNLSANSGGVKIYGGRIIGAIGGTTTGLGNFFNPTNVSWALNHNENGRLTVSEIALRSGGGIGLDSALPSAGNINTTANKGILVTGTSVLLVNTTDIRAMKPIKVEDTTARLYAGAGTPEGAVTASPGSVYLNTSGGAGVSLYIKESGSGNTGWVAK